MRSVLLVSLILIAACGEDEGATMRPGEDCKSCHGYPAAGTVFPSAKAAANEGIDGVTVTVVDSDQKTVTMKSNSAGNFFTESAIKWPAKVTLTMGSRTATMLSPAPNGACASSSCHTTAAQGRVFLP